jgi:hypothetical protein
MAHQIYLETKIERGKEGDRADLGLRPGYLVRNPSVLGSANSLGTLTEITWILLDLLLFTDWNIV